MSPNPPHLNQETDRTPPRSISATMPVTPSRSSKEWSASALERDREAKDEVVLQQKLLAQLATIQAQIKKVEENVKRNSEQAAIERQKAKDQEFYEISLTQQEKFRGTFADDVFTRVAQTLTKDEDFNYVTAIGEGRLGLEDPTNFKAMLWEAVAGEDPTFLQQAAQKIAYRYKKTITDEDVLAIRNSVSCHSPRFVSDIQPQAVDTNGERMEQTINQDRSLLDIWGGPQLSIPLADDTWRSTKQDANIIKLEGFERLPDKRNLMDKIEQDTTVPIVRSVSVAHGDINVQLTDALGNIITGEESEAELSSNLVERTPTQGAEPETPADTRKRPLEDAGTPTPSEVASTSASKKRKTSGQKSSAKSPATKFQDYIGSLFKSGSLDENDLVCSVCSQEAKNPRIARCHHVYCINCITSHKNGAKGKEANKLICARADCDSPVGKLSIVTETAINQLKTMFIVKNGNQEVRGNDDAEEDLEDEFTDMEE